MPHAEEKKFQTCQGREISGTFKCYITISKENAPYLCKCKDFKNINVIIF